MNIQTSTAPVAVDLSPITDKLNTEFPPVTYVQNRTLPAGVVLAHWRAQDIASVSSWVSSVGALDLAQSNLNPTLQPTIVAGAANGFPAYQFDGSNDFLSLTTPLAVRGLFVVCKKDPVAGNNGYVAGGTLAALRLPTQADNGRCVASCGSVGQGAATLTDQPVAEWQVLAMTIDASNRIISWRNGANGTIETENSAFNFQFVSKYINGGGTPFYLDGAVAEVVATSALTAEERMQIEDYLFEKFNIQRDTSVQLIFDGNSLPNGTGVTDQTLIFPTRVASRMGLGSINLSVGGQNWVAMLADVANQVVPLIQGGRRASVVVACESNNALNILVSPGVFIDVADVFAYLIAYGTAVKNAGGLFVVNTVTPRTGGVDVRTDFEAARLALRTMILEDTSGVIDGVYDIGDTSSVLGNILGDFSVAPKPSMFYADTVHYNDAGHGVVANAVVQVLDYLLAAERVRSPLDAALDVNDLFPGGKLPGRRINSAELTAVAASVTLGMLGSAASPKLRTHTGSVGVDFIAGDDTVYIPIYCNGQENYGTLNVSGLTQIGVTNKVILTPDATLNGALLAGARLSSNQSNLSLAAGTSTPGTARYVVAAFEGNGAGGGSWREAIGVANTASGIPRLSVGGTNVDAQIAVRTGSVDPTTADIPAGFASLWKTTGGSLMLAANDGGTIKKVLLT